MDMSQSFQIIQNGKIYSKGILDGIFRQVTRKSAKIVKKPKSPHGFSHDIICYYIDQGDYLNQVRVNHSLTHGLEFPVTSEFKIKDFDAYEEIVFTITLDGKIKTCFRASTKRGNAYFVEAIVQDNSTKFEKIILVNKNGHNYQIAVIDSDGNLWLGRYEIIRIVEFYQVTKDIKFINFSSSGGLLFILTDEGEIYYLDSGLSFVTTLFPVGKPPFGKLIIADIKFKHVSIGENSILLIDMNDHLYVDCHNFPFTKILENVKFARSDLSKLLFVTNDDELHMVSLSPEELLNPHKFMHNFGHCDGLYNVTDNMLPEKRFRKTKSAANRRS